MLFSSKAQEIHDHIVSSGKADYWMGVARSLAERRGQHQPGKRYARDVPALRDKLQAELSGRGEQCQRSSLGGNCALAGL